MSDPRAEVAGLYEQAAAEFELAAQHTPGGRTPPT